MERRKGKVEKVEEVEMDTVENVNVTDIVKDLEIALLSLPSSDMMVRVVSGFIVFKDTLLQYQKALKESVKDEG